MLAFLWDDGTITTLDPLSGDSQSSAVGINGNGTIVGGSTPSSGEGHAVHWILASDTKPPDLTVSVTPSRLWPPSHKYVTATATVAATDDTDPNPEITLVSVTSNEPDDDTPSVRVKAISPEAWLAERAPPASSVETTAASRTNTPSQIPACDRHTPA